MNFNQILLRTYESDIEELELELADLTYYPGFDGEIIEKYVTCKRPNCICHRGYPHGPNKYFKYREGKESKELYLGKKITDTVCACASFANELQQQEKTVNEKGKEG